MTVVDTEGFKFQVLEIRRFGVLKSNSEVDSFKTGIRSLIKVNLRFTSVGVVVINTVTLSTGSLLIDLDK